MLDNLSHGRLQIGVGRGISALEHQFWGYDPEQARDRFSEALAVLVRGLTDDRLSYEGRYYRFDGLPMELRPKQTPYPPFWYAGNVEFAARHGMNFIGNAGVKRLPEVVARYHELWQAGRDDTGRLNPHVLEPKVGSARHLFLADSDEEAQAIARRAWHAYHRNFPKRGYETPAPPGTGPSLGGDFDLACRVEAVIVGTPETLRRYLDRYTAESGANYFVGAFQWGDLTHEEALRSLRLFTAEVMPRFGGSREPGAGSREAAGSA
jgi:alkanesulfonate monooxygenase SsuD/methylene tetrahydromethanopterin reductase-like flavin-dependent oxidoreductase (luciferase family)